MIGGGASGMRHGLDYWCDRDPGDEQPALTVEQRAKLDEIYGQQCADTDGMALSRAEDARKGAYIVADGQRSSWSVEWGKAMLKDWQQQLQNQLITTLEAERDELIAKLAAAEAQLAALTPAPAPQPEAFPRNALRHSV